MGVVSDEHDVKTFQVNQFFILNFLKGILGIVRQKLNQKNIHLVVVFLISQFAYFFIKFSLEVQLKVIIVIQMIVVEGYSFFTWLSVVED